MRVTRPQIINGLTGYIQQEILPKMEDDRALKILFSVAVNAIKANDKLIDKYLSNDIVKALIDDDGSGNYDIERLMDWIRTSVEEYGAFPVIVPPIPLVSPREITLRLGPSDIIAIQRQIEDPLALEILEGHFAEGDHILVDRAADGKGLGDGRDPLCPVQGFRRAGVRGGLRKRKTGRARPRRLARQSCGRP